MTRRKIYTTPFIPIALIVSLMFWSVPQAGAGLKKTLTWSQLKKERDFYDDPRPFLDSLDWKKLVPQEEVEKVLVDVEASKKAWAEVLGFKAPDIVGEIAPEIKPGVYNYKDKEKYPGLKELMIPHQYDMFNPPAPPFPGNFREMEIIPTRQYFNPLIYSEMTTRNLGKTQQDDKGYVLWKTYEGGLPWPKPSGPHKAMQVMYNQQWAPQACDNNYLMTEIRSFNKKLKEDGVTRFMGGQLKTHGRMLPPLGWYDDRAEKQNELRTRGVGYIQPRSDFGMAIGDTQYIDPLKYSSNLMYIPGFRRIRKLSTTDTQDLMPGSDLATDDQMGFAQKMHPKKYPYEYKVIVEREFLVNSYLMTGEDSTIHFTSPEKGVERINSKWERRPIYVVEMTQLDSSYNYSKRILYIDKETFMIHNALMYDQKGKLWRSTDLINTFLPAGAVVTANTFNIQRDHIDTHSSLHFNLALPDPRIGREVGSIQDLMGTK